MNNDFRQSKYLNESGSKRGKWYLNRLDYFEFHQYPQFKRHKIMAIVGFVLAFYLITFATKFSGLLWCAYVVVCFYLTYLSVCSWIILHRQVCKRRGYLFYPKSWLAHFKSLEKTTDLQDFDSIATMSDKTD